MIPASIKLTVCITSCLSSILGCKAAQLYKHYQRESPTSTNTMTINSAHEVMNLDCFDRHLSHDDITAWITHLMIV